MVDQFWKVVDHSKTIFKPFYSFTMVFTVYGFWTPLKLRTRAQVAKADHAKYQIQCIYTALGESLFSGVGTLGIEALSRGAKKVKFIDNNNSAISILKKNILLLDLTEKSSMS